LKQKLFVLNPANTAFVEGTAPYMPPPVPKVRGTILFLLFFVLGGLTLALGTLREWYVYRQLREVGITTQAQILSHEMDSDEDGTTYLLGVRFETNDGRDHESTATVNEEQYEHYVDGDTITIRYLPEDPDIVRANWESGAFPGFEIFLTGLSVVWNLGIWAIVIGTVQQRRKLARLALGGDKLIGEITQATSSRDENDIDDVTIHYTFTSFTGKTLKGKDQFSRSDLNGQMPENGTPVMVLYRDDENFMLL
jgi:hypothetical protein